MAALTRKQITAIQRILYNARRARDYIMDDRVAVARVDSAAPTDLHYTRAMDGRILYEVAKDIGSDLCGLDDAIQGMESFLALHHPAEVQRRKAELAHNGTWDA